MAFGFVKDYKKGTVIVREGDMTTHIYILKRGSISIVKDDKVVAVLDHPGTVFGEMSMLLDESRTATLKAATDCTLNVLKLNLKELVREFPAFATKLLQTLALRVRDTTELLTESMVEIQKGEHINEEIEQVIKKKAEGEVKPL